MSVRLGRIGYLNVLPIHHPLETGIIENDFEIVAGPPAELNVLMDAGQLDLSGCSSIEYARHHEKYYLIPDIAIGSRGPVQSVLLLSRKPVKELDGRTVLVSAQTHTSAALLRVLLAELWGISADYVTGDATAMLETGEHPEAILCIGDEALNLRYHQDYPVRTDLGEAWRQLTGEPFIFGVWIASRKSYAANETKIRQACETLMAARRWGTDHLAELCVLAAEGSRLNQREMCSYFVGLLYDFAKAEVRGLRLFYEYLSRHGIIKAVPPINFLPGTVDYSTE
ncbi:menaquinone biosynthetic enzyme MqnA/MqnD family protein [Pseudodesulfovibrio sp.]|uniref:menaquinone biosynthetic enzyme MqnA/MqnD family protein n=1 Tax=unclassified Pseudodesulfovibrio TaxID=2661612 RepID=UPI003AFF7746